MFTFLLVVHALVAASLVAVILLQRSEGGGLGMGGSPSGLMSARGAADFLTRATTILATIFVVMSIGLAAYAGVQRAQRPIDTSLARPAGATGAPAPAPGSTTGGVPLADPLAGAAAAAGGALPQGAAPAPAAIPGAPVEQPKPAPATKKTATAAPSERTTRAADAKPADATPATPSPAPSPPPATSPTPTPKADSTPATLPAPAPSNGSVPLAQ